MSSDAAADKPLTPEDRIEVFRIATSGLLRRYGEQIEAGMTDDDLRNALAMVLGTFGGSCGPDRLDVLFQGAGLKIWGGWHVFNHVQTKPLFEGDATAKMARETYGIANPDDAQLSLL